MSQQFKTTSADPTPTSAKLQSSSPSQHGIEGLAICASPGDFAAPSALKRRPTMDNRSLAAALQQFAVDHQLALFGNMVFLLALTHLLFPSLRTITRACFTLSYQDDSGDYGQGARDLYFVAAFVVYFTSIRAFVMDFILVPLAGACGIKKRRAKVRFVEQTYQILYYSIYWTWGVYLFVQSTPSDVKTVDGLLESLWQGFPVLLQDGGMKLYYLTQLAFWIHQVLVLHLEERRKDHYQMLSHHFVTIFLMVGSHGYRQWRVGVTILVLMDVVDLIFSTAKILRYLGLQTACDCAFGVFVLTWIFTRHICYLAVCWSIYAHVNVRTMFYGTYSLTTGKRLSTDGGDEIIRNLLQPFLHPNAPTLAFNRHIQNWFLGLLLALHCITLVWLVMIIRVVIRVLRGEGADDSRSDDEAEDDDLADELADPPALGKDARDTLEGPRYIEVETTSEDTVWSSAASSRTVGIGANGSSGVGASGAAAPALSRRKSKGISSGLNLGEHKDILNRIGCLSEEQLAREREKREGSVSPRPNGSTSGGTGKRKK